jgi:hypothetical protein
MKRTPMTSIVILMNMAHSVSIVIVTSMTTATKNIATTKNIHYTPSIPIMRCIIRVASS